MDPLNYYTTTLVTAFKQLAPIIAFLIGGYFIFIKLPFLFLKKSMNEQKRKLEVEGEKKQGEEKYTLEHYQEFQKRLRLMNQGPENKQKEKVKNKEERRQENKRPDPPKSKSPEEVFELKPGEILSGIELKRRYFELLKQNHPDRVASMGAEFKTLAEKNTKEINKAYEALKRRAS